MNPKSNVFASFLFTEQEEVEASILSQLNVAAIQNLISEIATQKLYLTLDVSQPFAHLQEEAYLRGQLDILQTLLDRHNAAITAN